MLKRVYGLSLGCCAVFEMAPELLSHRCCSIEDARKNDVRGNSRPVFGEQNYESHGGAIWNVTTRA